MITTFFAQHAVKSLEQSENGCWSCSSVSQLSHLGLIDEQVKIGNLSPDLVLFADEVMDTLGQLLLVRQKDQQHLQ